MGAQLVREGRFQNFGLAGDARHGDRFSRNPFPRKVSARHRRRHRRRVQRGIIKPRSRHRRGEKKIFQESNESHRDRQVATVSAATGQDESARYCRRHGQGRQDGTITVEEAKSIETTREVVSRQCSSTKVTLSLLRFVTTLGGHVGDPQKPHSSYERKSRLDGHAFHCSRRSQNPDVRCSLSRKTWKSMRLATLVVNKLRGTFGKSARSKPGFAIRRRRCWKHRGIDLPAKISEDLGIKLEKHQLRRLGQGQKINK